MIKLCQQKSIRKCDSHFTDEEIETHGNDTTCSNLDWEALGLLGWRSDGNSPKAVLLVS